MEGLNNLASHEQLAPHVEVFRFSALDEPEEPYIDYPMDGFLAFKYFIRNLKEKYPENKYPNDEVLDRIKGQDTYSYRDLITYLAESGSNLAGVVIGKHNGRRFDGTWFAIDPKFQRSNVTKKLIEAVERDHDEITLLASTFGYVKADEGSARHANRQQALIEMYKRLGFSVDTSSDSYYPSLLQADNTASIPMIWRRSI